MQAIQDERWEAVRDRRSEPDFIFGVRTTRIACRPGCPSRTPDPRNVRYFNDFAAAQRAGYRACKRCAPDTSDPSSERRAAIERACALFASDENPSIDEVASRVGFSRFHFQRIFRAVTGISPAVYRRALRDRRFRELLASGRSVTEAIGDAGYESASTAYASRTSGISPRALKNGARGERLRYAIADSSLGRVLVAVSENGVAAIELGDTDDETLAHVRRHFREAQLERAQDDLGETIAAVVGLIDRSQGDARLDLDIRGTAFQRRIWDALKNVPPGERVTYRELAAAAGVPGAAQAAGAACGANRLAVVIPCHRAVRGDGELAGYRWGIERKAALLEREGRRRSRS
jgi:AraC family transcriptional regulator, regulatory protein of adaptative response / methylated-DNA-[protein]-cysteine methyltransferase